MVTLAPPAPAYTPVEIRPTPPPAPIPPPLRYPAGVPAPEQLFAVFRTYGLRASAGILFRVEGEACAIGAALLEYGTPSHDPYPVGSADSTSGTASSLVRAKLRTARGRWRLWHKPEFLVLDWPHTFTSGVMLGFDTVISSSVNPQIYASTLALCLDGIRHDGPDTRDPVRVDGVRYGARVAQLCVEAGITARHDTDVPPNTD